MVFSKMFGTVVLCLSLGLSVSGCGKNSGSKNGNPQNIKELKANVNRIVPRSEPAFFQFSDLVGKAPQTAFDPNYKPKSRANKNPQHTRESAGALIYTIEKGDKFVLIGKEASNGNWNFMRGSVDAGESYVESAVHELHEETAGVFKATKEVLLSESFDVFTDGNEPITTYACTFFVKFDYVPEQVFNNALKSPKLGRKFKEMTEYAWIRLDDLQKALSLNTSNFAAKTAEGVTQDFQFLKFSFNILKQAQDKNILSNLD